MRFVGGVRSAIVALVAGGAGLGSLGCGSADGGHIGGVSLDVSATGYRAELSITGCAAIGDVTVTFDGEAGVIASRGGVVPVFGGGTRCEFPVLTLARAVDFSQAVPTTEMVVAGAGGATLVHAAFAQVVGPVALELSPPDQTLAPGAAVTFQLTPTTDSIISEGLLPKLRWDTPLGIRSERDAQASGNRIMATIPSDARSGDTLVLSVGMGTGVIQAATTLCEGPERCGAYPQVLFPSATIVLP